MQLAGQPRRAGCLRPISTRGPFSTQSTSAQYNSSLQEGTKVGQGDGKSGRGGHSRREISAETVNRGPKRVSRVQPTLSRYVMARGESMSRARASEREMIISTRCAVKRLRVRVCE
jgi:hypothetical protein